MQDEWGSPWAVREAACGMLWWDSGPPKAAFLHSPTAPHIPPQPPNHSSLCLHQVICVSTGLQTVTHSVFSHTAAVIQVESSENGKTSGHGKDARPFSACGWTQGSFWTLQSRVGLLWSYCLCLLRSVILLGSDCAVVLFSTFIFQTLISRGLLHRDQWERHQAPSSIKPCIQQLISTRKGVEGIQQGASLFLCWPGTPSLD